MQAAMSLLLTLVFAAALGVSAVEENPLGKVIELIDDLSAKIVSDGEAEEKAYHEYYEWCDDTAHNLANQITTAKSRKAKLEAQIIELSSDIENADSEVEKLAAAVAESDADLKKATAVRAEEASDFAEGQKELEETIDTISRALAILQRQAATSPGSLAQIDSTTMSHILLSLSTIVDAASLSTDDQSKLMAFIQDDDSEPGAPAAAAYESQGSGIMELLGDLKDKSEEQLADLRKTEATSKANFELLRESMEDQAAQDSKHLDAEKSAKAAAEEGKAGAEGDLTTTTKELKGAEEALAETRKNCMLVAADHDATLKGRAEELKVIAEAKKILLETSGAAVEQTYSFVQVSQGASAGVKVVDMVKKLAARQHSAALAQLGSRISAVVRYGAGNNDSPFGKVKGLIDAMIVKLEKEAGEDAQEKAWCDEQMAKTEAKKGDLEETNEKLTTKIDQDASKSAELKEEVKGLQGEIGTIVREQAEMDRIRQEEHADYIQSKADLEVGLGGVRKALGVLRDYYARDDEASEFVQQPAQPATFKKSGGAGGSIIGILEVCEDDMAKELAKVEQQEADELSVYKKTTQENKVNKATKEEDVTGKTNEFKTLDVNIAELSDDQQTVAAELAAVNEYYTKVKERCVAKPESYEERKKRREAEIAGLKEALTVLTEDTAFVQRKRNFRGGKLSSK